MQTVLAVIMVVNLLAVIVLAGALESFSGKWRNLIGALLSLCVVLWLVSIVLGIVFLPGSSTPDPRF